MATMADNVTLLEYTPRASGNLPLRVLQRIHNYCSHYVHLVLRAGSLARRVFWGTWFGFLGLWN